MKTLLFTAFLLRTLGAQSLPVVPMQMDPDQLARSLREGKPPMPAADCKALDLWECQPDYPERVSDISLRWVHFDEGTELQAILVAEEKAEDSYAAYVFDKRGTWNLVGSFVCRQNRCDVNTLIRVQKLTLDSPPLLLCYRGLGGSGIVNEVTEAFQLRGGKLWPVLEVMNYEENPFVDPHTTRQQVFTSSSRDRLVIHTIREEPPGHIAQTRCEVRRWDVAKHTFVPAAKEQTTYCDAKTGKPIAGMSWWTGLPTHP
jgi:hypothetical protein